MAKIWKEWFDPSKHWDFMSTDHKGGWLPGDGRGGLNHEHPFMKPHWVYLVREGGFTFVFHSFDQVRECLEWFQARTHHSTCRGVDIEHFWQRWYERLPKQLMRGQRRERVVKALTKAIEQFAY